MRLGLESTLFDSGHLNRDLAVVRIIATKTLPIHSGTRSGRHWTQMVIPGNFPKELKILDAKPESIQYILVDSIHEMKVKLGFEIGKFKQK